MFCSVTVSVTPIVAASHAARSLRLPASPLGDCPVNQGYLGSSMLENWKLSNTRHFPLNSKCRYRSPSVAVVRSMVVEALLN